MNIGSTGNSSSIASSVQPHGDAAGAATPVQANAQQPVDVWRSRMTGPGFRDIEGNEVPDEHIEMVAGLCLELACGHHSDAVKRVLSINANVRAHALTLLKAEPPRDADQQSALALCMLDAGYPIPLDEELAEPVTRIVEARDQWEEEHWAGKAEKFKDQAPPDPLYRAPDYQGFPPKYQGKGLPHFYDDPKYSLLNLNGHLTATGYSAEVVDDSPVCKQLQKATDGTLVLGGNRIAPKEFLTLPLEQGTSAVGLNRDQLTRADDADIRRTFGINFEQQNFGALLRDLCMELPVGVERSFRMGFRKKIGHAQRVFLTKEPATDKHPEGIISVALYEPGVTRNRIHMKVLPERLAFLQFDQFDSRHTRTRGGATVLNLRVGDRKLAAECAGKFVSPAHEARVAGLSQAVAMGDHKEVERLLGELRNDAAESFTPEEIADLANGLSWAIGDEDSDGVALFMKGLGALRLSAQQKAQIAAARGVGEQTAIAGLLQKAGTDACDTVLAFVSGLREMEFRPAQIFDILMGAPGRRPLLSFLSFSNAGPTIDHWGRPRPHLLSPLLAALKDIGLDDTQIDQLVNAPDEALLPRMVANGDRAAVSGFLQGLKNFRSPAELVAPGIAALIRHGNAAGIDQFLDEMKWWKDFPFPAIVQYLIRKSADGKSLLQSSMDTRNPRVLNALSNAIYRFAEQLDGQQKKDLLAAIESVQGKRIFLGIQNSDAMKAMKKADPEAFRRFNAAKAVLRR